MTNAEIHDKIEQLKNEMATATFDYNPRNGEICKEIAVLQGKCTHEYEGRNFVKEKYCPLCYKYFGDDAHGN